MGALPRRHQILSGATVTANGNSGILPNLGESNAPYAILVIHCPNAPTGTTPTLTFTLNSIMPDGTPLVIQAGTAISAAGAFRIVCNPVLEDRLEVSWAVSGTTPSFTGVNVDLYMSSPDS